MTRTITENNNYHIMAPHRNDQRQDHNPAHEEDDDDHQDHISYYRRLDLTLLEMASAELEKIRLEEESEPKLNLSSSLHMHHAFPPACLAVLKTLGGNNRCVDCEARDPQWAAVSYGAVLCLACSGRHRGLGVQVSCVRSISMDSWSQEAILAMLEGGNDQLKTFFERHALVPATDTTVSTCQESSSSSSAAAQHLHKDNLLLMRYKTKAALFYRQQMQVHVRNIKAGPYRGREAARRAWRHRNSSVS